MRGGRRGGDPHARAGHRRTTTMFSVVYGALLRPPPFAEPDRLVLLYVTRTTPTDRLVRLRWSRPGIEAISTDYFRVLRVTPSFGRAFLAEEDGATRAHPVVVSERLSRRGSRRTRRPSAGSSA